MNFDDMLPQALRESTRRNTGLVVLVGNRFSRITKTAEYLGQKLYAEKKTELDYEFVRSDKSLDYVLGKVESGKLVYWIFDVPSILHALHLIEQMMGGPSVKNYAWRFADALNMMLSQVEVHSINPGEMVLLHEILLATPWVRKTLEEMDIKNIEDSLRSSTEDSGMTSMNHCLMQNLVRRKIDVRTAFETTRDPVHLDQILKKAGF